MLLLPVTGEMYDLLLPNKVDPQVCENGCARWRALEADGSRQSQLAADAMWRRGPPAGNDCAMPGRAVQCCNMYNASLAGLWPDCCAVWEMVPAPAPWGSLGAVCPGAPPPPKWQQKSTDGVFGAMPSELQEEYTDKAALTPPTLGDTPLCYPGTPAHTMAGPGFNGAFCWCKNPPPEGARWGLCTSAPAVVEQLNLQLAGPRSVVVSFATFHNPGCASHSPSVQLRGTGGVKTVYGVTHVYGMNSTGHSTTTNKTYYLHFVRLSGLRERTAYSYRARAGGHSGGWSDWRNFTSLYSSGETKIALFGDMGVYSWNAMSGLLSDSSHRMIDCIVHMGDHAYNYGDANGSRADAYLDGYSRVLGSTPWVPVVGNHEGYDSFYFFFNETDGENTSVDPAAAADTTQRGHARQPHPMTQILRTGVGQFGAGARSQPDLQPARRQGSGTPRWFSLQIGLVHLVAIDSMVDWAAPASVHNQTGDAAVMLEWLETDLISVDRESTPWVVVVAHYPVFCSGCLTGTPSGMPAALQPLFIEHGVDLYAAGHWHYCTQIIPSFPFPPPGQVHHD
jgi:hypothetical protein